MKRLVAYGAVYPDIVKLVDAINRENQEWEFVGFIEDRVDLHGRNFLGAPVLGGKELLEDLSKESNIYFFNNYYGKLDGFIERIKLLESYGCKIPTLIHPKVDINHVKIGRGCIIEADCSLGGNIEIEDFVSIRHNSSISHDTKLEKYTFIAPCVTVGSVVTLKQGCFIGTGATIMRTRTVGNNSTVGAGALVVKNVPDETTVVGVPAKRLIKNPFKRVFNRIKRDWRKFSKDFIIYKESQKT